MKKSSINNGLFLGVAMVIGSYVLYLANPKMFFSAKSIVLLMIFIIVLIKAGKDARTENGGYISFKEAFINMFVTGAIGTLLCTSFEFVLFNFIDPGLIDIQKEIALEAAEKVTEMLGGLGEEYEVAFEQEIEKIEEGNPASMAATIKNYFARLIAPVALLSAIIGLVIKRRGTGSGPADDLDKPRQGYVVNK